MRTETLAGLVAFLILMLGVSTLVFGQQPQIPTLQVCNLTKVQGKAVVKIVSRSDASHTGTFRIGIDLVCEPQGTSGYPVGTLTIGAISMSDSVVQGDIASVTVEQMTSTGRHSPTVYLNGRCKAAQVSGCRFWLMLADNKKANQPGTPDVIGFLVFNAAGQRVAYGTGSVIEGDITVAPTPN